MLTLFITAVGLGICTFMIKKSFWLSSNNIDDINLQQSLFCWFTFQDISNSEKKATSWIFLANNITNLIIAICFLITLVGITLFGLSIVS